MIGNLTKQLAQQAIGNQVKDVVDALRPPDLAAIGEKLMGGKEAPAAQPDNIAATILGQIQAMQKALKEDEELVVLCTTGLETVRVLEFFLPSPRVVVLTGIDTEKTVTRLISPIDAVQLVCKPMPVQAPAKPVRLRFITPKPKPE